MALNHVKPQYCSFSCSNLFFNLFLLWKSKFLCWKFEINKACKKVFFINLTFTKFYLIQYLSNFSKLMKLILDTYYSYSSWLVKLFWYLQILTCWQIHFWSVRVKELYQWQVKVLRKINFVPCRHKVAKTISKQLKKTNTTLGPILRNQTLVYTIWLGKAVHYRQRFYI